MPRLMYHAESDSVFVVSSADEYVSCSSDGCDDVTGDIRFENKLPKQTRFSKDELRIINGAARRYALRVELGNLKKQFDMNVKLLEQARLEIIGLHDDLKASNDLVDNYAYVTGMTVDEIESRVGRS